MCVDTLQSPRAFPKREHLSDRKYSVSTSRAPLSFPGRNKRGCHFRKQSLSLRAVRRCSYHFQVLHAHSIDLCSICKHKHFIPIISPASPAIPPQSPRTPMVHRSRSFRNRNGRPFDGDPGQDLGGACHCTASLLNTRITGK